MKSLCLMTVAAVLCLGSAFAQEEKKDPIADIKAQVKDPAKPFSLIVEFTLKPGSGKEFRKLVQESVKNTRKEAGNAAYSCHQDAKDPNKFVFFEIWRSIAGLEEHIKQDYVKALLGGAESLSAQPPVIRVLTPWVPAPPKPKAADAAPAPAAGGETKPAEKTEAPK